MKVKLDLRPREAIIAAQKKVDVMRLTALTLICLFPLMACASLVCGFLLSQELTSQVKSLSLSVEMLKKRHADISDNLAALKGNLELYRKAVAFAKDELPALECLSAVEAALLDVMWLSRLEINAGRAMLQGYATTEGEVVEFARGLLVSPVISNVDLPVTRRVKRDGMVDVVEFSLNCSLRNLGDLRGGVKGALPEK